jgi:hypothetical protein
MLKEAERAEPVVDCDHDDPVGRELRSVVVAGGVGGQPTAMDPHQDRPIIATARARRVDVEVQAVF